MPEDFQAKRHRQVQELNQDPLNRPNYTNQAVGSHEPPLLFAGIGLMHSTVTLKRANPNADVSAFEIEIGCLFYQPYDLTPTEITVVENI